jgi:hypothetical protein
MKLRKVKLPAVILLLVLAPDLPAQFSLLETKKDCGTVVSEKQRTAEQARLARGYNFTLAPLLNRPYQLPLTIHIVRLDDGTGGFTLNSLQVAMQDLNRLWLPAGIQFYQRGAVDYINNTFYFNLPPSEIARDNLRQINSVADTINVYFTNVNGLCGQSSFTTAEFQGVLIDNNCAGLPANPSTFAHEIGHYFDLYHTHDTTFGVECPSGNNCTTAGDLLCDTPADPDLNQETDVDTACTWTGSAATPMGCDMTNYAPSTRNMMSNSRKTCRDAFTGNQISKLLNILTTEANRSNLINTLTKYVAPDGGLNTNCSYQTPCRTPSRALEVANPGNAIFLLSGSYPFGLLPTNKAVTMRKWNTDAGTVIIGQ